jgi:hypothetical protein
MMMAVKSATASFCKLSRPKKLETDVNTPRVSCSQGYACERYHPRSGSSIAPTTTACVKNRNQQRITN